MDEINKIKDYLNAESKERKDIVKKNSRYIVAFDYADKLFITLFKRNWKCKLYLQNELDKACFAHAAAYSDSQDLTKRTIADKILKSEAFNIAKDQNMMGIKED